MPTNRTNKFLRGSKRRHVEREEVFMLPNINTATREDVLKQVQHWRKCYSESTAALIIVGFLIQICQLKGFAPFTYAEIDSTDLIQPSVDNPKSEVDTQVTPQ